MLGDQKVAFLMSPPYPFEHWGCSTFFKGILTLDCSWTGSLSVSNMLDMVWILSRKKENERASMISFL